jgi:hypothetical protein
MPGGAQAAPDSRGQIGTAGLDRDHQAVPFRGKRDPNAGHPISVTSQYDSPASRHRHIENALSEMMKDNVVARGAPAWPDVSWATQSPRWS